MDGRFGGWGGFGPPDAAQDSSGALRWALTERPDDAALPVLLAALADPDDCTRAIATRLVARSRTEAVVAGLMGALRSEAPGTRSSAAVGLGLADATAARDPLIEALRDVAGSVRADRQSGSRPRAE